MLSVYCRQYLLIIVDDNMPLAVMVITVLFLRFLIGCCFCILASAPLLLFHHGVKRGPFGGGRDARTSLYTMAD